MTSCRQVDGRRVWCVLVLCAGWWVAAPSSADDNQIRSPSDDDPPLACRLFDFEGLAAGYVDLSFTVTEEGTVRDPYVIRSDACDEDAIPSMEEAAIKAVLDFRYRPRVVDGEAVDVEGVRTRITFRLDEESEGSDGSEESAEVTDDEFEDDGGDTD